MLAVGASDFAQDGVLLGGVKPTAVGPQIMEK